MEDNENLVANNETPNDMTGSNASQSPTSSRNSIKMFQAQVSLGSLSSVRSNNSNAGSPIPQFLKERLKVNFVYPLEKKYECPNCKEVLRYPVIFEECGHRCCSHCFETEIKKVDNRRCPVDQNKIDVDTATIDKEFNQEILELEVKCLNHGFGCAWEGEYKQIQEHLESCDYTKILCVHDCGAKFQRRFLQKHREKDCPKFIIACAYCDDRHLREEKKEHMAECRKVPLPCPSNCEKNLSIPRDELTKHVNEICPKTKMNCDYENIGCGHRCSREKLPKHYKGSIIEHVRLIYNLAMENKNRLDEHDVTLAEHLGLIRESDRRIGALERIAHNAMIWRIEDYSRKLKEAQNGSNDTLFSPPFTTSKHGYRMCASVCLNGDGRGKRSHMSIFVSILKGAYDALLKWPFDYRVTFYLLDQHENPAQRKHVKFSIKPNTCKDNEPFLGRPRLEKNASFGGAQFVRHDVMETQNYIREETIFIKIVVEVDETSEP